MAKEHQVEGATIEVEGTVYFIPMRELKAYRLPDDVAADFRPALDVRGKGRVMPSSGPIEGVRAVVGYVPLDRDRYLGAWGPDDFITLTRVH